jgi:hypothetical protein
MFEDMLQQKHIGDMNRFFLESVRHNPALCTAYATENGEVFVNAKIVGAGYVLKEKHLYTAVEAFERHIKHGDELFASAETEEQKRKAANEYQMKAATLFLEQLYFAELAKAEEHIDFSKMSTIELALSKPESSKHTWQIIQQNVTACLLFYQPPSISFEVRGKIEVHEHDAYHTFVNLVHDSFHYVHPGKRKIRRPVYIFSIEQVFDNSASATGFGTRIA